MDARQLPRGAVHDELASGSLQAVRLVEPTISRSVTLASSLARSANQACNLVARLGLEVARGLVEQGIWHGRLDSRR